jgi:hypothetical protein
LSCDQGSAVPNLQEDYDLRKLFTPLRQAQVCTQNRYKHTSQNHKTHKSTKHKQILEELFFKRPSKIKFEKNIGQKKIHEI